MLQNPCKTLGFKTNMVYKIPLGGGGGGKPYPASGLSCDTGNSVKTLYFCSREVLRDCFKRANSIEHHCQNRIFASEHTMVEK